MSSHEQDNHAVSVVELIAERGLEGLEDVVSMLINEVMRLERQRHLGVSPYERSPQRRGYANGYKLKTIKTRISTLDLAVPQVH